MDLTGHRIGRAPASRPARRGDAQKHEVKLTFDELALIYKSLQAVKTLGGLQPEDELLDDTIQFVDQALNSAIR
jgi:hypothetical protein